MNGLSCGEESMSIYSAVLIQCQRVTDGRTDVQPISITCFSIADARKNEIPVRSHHVQASQDFKMSIYVLLYVGAKLIKFVVVFWASESLVGLERENRLCE